MDLKDLTPINDTVNVPIVHPTTFDPLLNDDKSEMCVHHALEEHHWICDERAH